MERNISVEERIKRAEERYYNTLNRDYNNIKDEVNVQSNKNNITERTNKKRTLKRKVSTQILICLIIYGIFYCINNTNSLFSNDMKQKTKEILNTDINFSQIYSNLKCNIEKFFQNIQTNNNGQNSIKSTDIKNKLKIKQKRNISKYTINDVDLMTGTEFEEFVCLLFKKIGYSSQVTKQSGDQGIDVIAIRNGNKIGIQAKCYSNTVGNSAVQEAVAGKSFYNCDKVIVISNNYFTPAAIELAQSNGVVLWNRDMLKEKIKELM